MKTKSSQVILFSTIILLAFQLASPFAQAQLGTVANTAIKAIETKVTQSGLTYTALDESGQILKTIEIAKSSKSTVDEFKPSKIKEYFKYLKQNSGKISVQQIKHFPFEAFTFFVALGAITTKDLIFNYSDNPLASEQLIESQKDPVGQVGFAAFMMANGLTSQPLMAVVESRNLRPFIPYLGMSVGMTASNIVHEIGHFPGLKDCLKSMVVSQNTNKVDQEKAANCDKAYEAWTELDGNKKAHEWAPSLISMVGSTVMAGFAEKSIAGAIIKVGQASAAVRVRLIAIQMAFTLAPGGWFVKGTSWTMKIAQLAGFIYLDTVLKSPVSFAWKNAVQLGPELTASKRRIEILLKNKSLNRWNSETALNANGNPVCDDKSAKEAKNCYMDIDAEITYFSNLMKDWREANLEKVLISNSNWSQYLSKLSGQYSFTKKFYLDYVSEIWTSKFETKSGFSILDRELPLFGVKPADKDPNDLDAQFNFPDSIQQAQLKTIEAAAKKFETAIIAHPEWLEKALPSTKISLNKVRNGLSSKNIKDIGHGLIALNEMSAIKYFPQSENDIFSLVKQIHTDLGAPSPSLDAGEGYLKLLALNYKQSQTNMNSVDSMGSISMNNPLEYLVLQTLIGPDLESGENSVKKNLSGFADEFKAPKLRTAGQLRTYLNKKTKPYDNNLRPYSIFDYAGSIENNSVVKANNLFELSKSNIRGSILGNQNGSKISSWWTQYPENEFVQAWIDYEKKYEPIIADLYSEIWKTEDSRLNRSPFSNGLINSLRQERSIYLQIMKSILSGRPEAILHDKLQSEVATSVTNLEKLLKEIKLKTKQGREGSELVLVSRLSNKELQNSSDQVFKNIDDLSSQIAKSEILTDLNSLSKKSLIASLLGVRKTIEELLNYGLVINNVSYIENFQDGNFVKRRCVNTPTAKGTAQWLHQKIADCQ